MRWRTWAALSGFAVLGTALVACAPDPDGQGAACANPALRVDPASAVAGAEVQISGENFLEGCPDASAGTLAATDVAVPNTGISIELLGPDSAIVVGVVDAEEDGTFETTISIPPEAGPGVVEITTDVAGTASAELVIGES